MKKNTGIIILVLTAIVAIAGCTKQALEPKPLPLTITAPPLPSTVLAAGVQTIARVKVAANQTLTWYQLSFSYSSLNVTLTDAKLVDQDNNLAAECRINNGSLTCTSLIGTTVAAGETKIYSLKAVIKTDSHSAFVTTQAEFLTAGTEYNLRSFKAQTMGK